MNVPSEVEILAALVTGRGTADHAGNSIQRSIRFWPEVSLQIDALVESTGRTRNEIVNRLVLSGMDALKEHLTPDQADTLFRISPEVFKLTMEECK